MSTEPLPPWMQTKRRRVPRWLIALVALVAVAGLYCAGVNIYYHFKIQAELEAIRKACFPATLAEVGAWYPTPKGENAADVLNQAFTAFRDSPDDALLPFIGDVTPPLRGQGLPDDQLKAADQYLADNAAAIELLHKAAAIKDCRFPIDFSQGSGMLLPHLSKMRQAARLLELEGLVKAQRGDANGAAEAARAGLGVSLDLKSEPVMISSLVMIAMAEMALRSLERNIALTDFTEAQLAELSSALKAEEDGLDGAVFRGQVGERCNISDIFERLEILAQMNGSPEGLPSRAKFLFWRVSGILAADHFDALRRLDDSIAIASQPFPQRIAAVKEAQRAFERDASQRRLGPVSRMVLPSIGYESLQVARTLARLRAARVALAIERYRLANGKFPANVTELAPKYLDTLPDDPFDGRPIRARILSKGLMAYSVGEDLSDDGGMEPDPRDPYNHPGDVTFVIEK